MNDQRKVVYEQRKELMSVDDVSEDLRDMRRQVIDDLVGKYIPEGTYAEQWATTSLHEEVLRVFGIDLPIADWAKEEGIADAEIRERIVTAADRRMAEKAANFGAELMRGVEKSLLLQILDQVWKEHLLTLDHLRQGIGLRAYGQRDPLNEYKTEAFSLFEKMLDRLRERITTVLAHVELRMDEPAPAPRPEPPRNAVETRNDPAFVSDPRPAFDANDTATWGRVPRNAPCPCGSGRKYKHCHGKAV